MLLKIYPENPNPKAVRTVVECLNDGGIVIYPTDTIYGIGCDIFKQKSIERITIATRPAMTAAMGSTFHSF